MKTAATVVLTALFALSCGEGRSVAQKPPIETLAAAVDTQLRFREIARNAMPAVGYIYSLKAQKPPSFASLRNSGMSFREAVVEYLSSRTVITYRATSTGSGFLINKRGHMLTNYHLVENADKIMVKMDSEELDAVMLGADPLSDIAMIKIRSHYRNKPLRLGDSTSLEVGEWVLAIGNPYSLGRTFTVGVVSALKRGDLGIMELEDFIQTDAAINPGNSGGPLLNMDGEVVGINSAVLSGGAGLGFAVPVSIVRGILPGLVSGKRIERGMLGLGLQELTPELADALKAPPNAGVLVAGVYPGLPADVAGVKAGDIITKINGKKITRPWELKKSVLSMRAGVKVRLDLLRDGKEIVLDPTLAAFEPVS